jgi:hypothetical protein
MTKQLKRYELHHVTLDLLVRDRFGHLRHPMVPIVIDTETRMVVYDHTALDLIIADARQPREPVKKVVSALRRRTAQKFAA